MFGMIFVGEIEQKQEIWCLKHKSLNINFLFIELLHKINITFVIMLIFGEKKWHSSCDINYMKLYRSLCSWILDFLTGRSQVVRMGNNTSSPLTLNTGAPQGCVLSPLLYSLYTHDCAATHSSNVIVKFADDTTA